MSGGRSAFCEGAAAGDVFSRHREVACFGRRPLGDGDDDGELGALVASTIGADFNQTDTNLATQRELQEVRARKILESGESTEPPGLCL